MKKVLAMILTLVFALSLAACGDQEKEEVITSTADTAQTPDEAIPPEPETVPEATETMDVLYLIGETITTDSIELTVDSTVFGKMLRNLMDCDAYTPVSPDDKWYDTLAKTNPYYADDEHIMLMVEYRQKNTGKSKVDLVGDDDMKIIYGDGYEFEASGGGMQNGDGDFEDFSSMEPLSDEVLCRVAFSLPADAEGSQEALVLCITIDEINYKVNLRA